MKRFTFVLLAVSLLLAGMTVTIQAGDSWFERLLGGNGPSVRGSGDMTTEERKVSDFTEVELGTIGTLYIEVGDSEKLTIEAEDNLIEYIETRVRGDRLIITKDPDVRLRPRRKIRYYLTVKSLEEIRLTSAGDAEAEDLEARRFTIVCSSAGDFEMGTLRCDELDVRITSAGDVYIDDLEADLLTVDISSAGDCEIGGGTVTEQEVYISSAGDYDAKRLDSQRAHVETSSAGDAIVRVSDHLRARTSSVGDIVYYGDPEVRKKERGSGDIRRGGR